jgi:hypothetical protein
MPKYLDRFSGHMPEGDPRSPLEAAAGCTWPTVPPWRWKPDTSNAYGALSFWNAATTWLKRVVETPEHNWCQWYGQDLPFGCSYLILTKEYVPPREYVNWNITFLLNSPARAMSKNWTRVFGPCNVDVPVGDILDPYYPDSGMGSTFQLLQVEWDKTAPPDYP